MPKLPAIALFILLAACGGNPTAAPGAPPSPVPATATSAPASPTNPPALATAVGQATLPASLQDGVVYAGKFDAPPDKLDHPTGMARDANGNIYVIDGRNNRIVEFDRSGKVLNKSMSGTISRT